MVYLLSYENRAKHSAVLPDWKRQEIGSKGKCRIPLEPSHWILLKNPFHKSSFWRITITGR